MGRMPSFDAPVVVTAARDLFWDRGFEAASLADLERVTGLGRSSLYHAFGSKRGLFDAAVADYLETVIRPRLRPLLAESAGRAALLEYYGGLSLAVASLPADSPRRGCLLVNCAAGLAGHDDLARKVVDDYRSELTAALRHALAGAAAAAETTPGTGAAPAVLDERARTLASLSMSVMLLARVNRDESLALLATAAAQVQSWHP
ncbi:MULTISPECIES: helix-turn-helix domain-containing protein [unclassified Cryobacterium]|uniref:TetR/AcrR family transcriptional regulator n=2 Tax=Cryobacterium TaxID=69578 RepID=UPI002B238033|nr:MULTISPECIES: helix-turn-helix domain-containing protein [unclassified Cryobacterium]MEB0267133.1 helix-turn-helix domain-containing protein [Cryobacterium sp. 10I5]